MKLSDIDEMQRTKAEYVALAPVLKTAEAAAARTMTSGGLQLGGQTIPWHVVAPAVTAAAHVALKDHVDKLVAKLMLYGVDDWEVKK